MISCVLDHVGNDNLIVISGGTAPHIGAVVIATYEKGQVKVISYGFPNHKEEDLFVELAKVWCNTFQQKTVILGGIHIDNATKEQIESLCNETWDKFFHLMADQKASKILA
ncbi:hypothetical protein DS745_18250 [Anaerobacillus alkaliphilus]|uniref:Prenylated flavin chaperone LpdD-like domain-containing protein n=1 Tax=Anaerobacillus alkaliphilus TaxID=1548597 RepID=A0A4Q0VPA0_9BACI|nr:hypothetical protein [Anaerobacillus alkaliphilus]RXI98276.1 hypothetical protein DS745_18250 [Anaerobacillus alkaliphilus]